MSTPHDADLSAALEGLLGRRVETLKRAPSPFRTSFALEDLDVGLDDGTVLPMVFKDLGWQAMHEGARRAKPSFLHEPLREIDTYRSILAPARLGPVCHGAVVD